jgi:hypothetical protein
MGVGHLMGLGLSLCLAGHAAQAADKVVASVATLTTAEGTATSLMFDYQNCEDECRLGKLTCEPSAAITLELADIKAKHAANAIAQNVNQIVLKAGAKVFDYTITDMKFAELSVAWWLTAQAQDSKPGEIAKAIAIARFVEAKVGGWTVKMPVNDTVRKWADACK